MRFLKNTFGIITLQVGVVAFSSVFITLAACIYLVNALSLDLEEPTAWIIMLLFIFVMIIVWSIAFFGACKEQQKLIYTATVIWEVYLVLWIVLITWSLIQPNKNICIKARCPNTLWLSNNSWYELKYSTNEKIELNNSKGLKLTGVTPLIEQMKAKTEVISKFNETQMTPKHQRSGLLTIIITILYIILLLYSLAILLSYRKEMQLTINPQTE